MLGCMYPFELWFSLGISPGAGSLGHMLVIHFIFEGTSILFSIGAVSVYTPPKEGWGVAWEELGNWD